MAAPRSPGIFATEAPPLHVGRKAIDGAAGRRSKSDDGFMGAGKRRVYENAESQDNFAAGLRTKEGATLQERRPVKHHVEGSGPNRSRCPWQPENFAARDTRPKKRPGHAASHPEHRLGKAQFPAQASYLASQSKAEEHPHRRRTPEASRLLWTAESKEIERRPLKRMVSCERRSLSADHETPRRLVRSTSQNSSGRHTPLWGPQVDSVPAGRPTGVRMCRTPSSDGLSQPRTPYATSFDLNGPPPAQIGGRSRSPGQRSFDSYRNATDDVGKAKEFRPHNRLFSREDSHDKLFGRAN